MGRCQALLARWPRLESAVEAARPYLPPLNFITLHYAYFLLVCLVFTLVFWGASEPRLSIGFVDSLFCVVSAMSEAGLNTVNLSQMTTFQQILLLLLIMLGSQIWVSIWTVLARKRAFESRFQDIVRKERERAKSTDKRLDLTINLPIMRSLSRTFGKTQDRTTEHEGEGSGRRPGLALRTATSGSLHISRPVAVERMSKTAAPAASDEKGPDVESTPADAPERGRTTDRTHEYISFRGDEKGADANPAPGAAPETGRLAAADRTNQEHISFSEDVEMTRARTTASVYDANSVFRRRPSRVREASADSAADPPRPEPSHRQFLTAKTVGRNAQFHDLSTEERELLGGTEYRALKVLAVVVPTYFFLWQVLGCLALGAWISRNLPGPARANAINPWWNGIFNAISAFNNSGMSVLDANMVPYGGSYFVLVAMGALILAGNTAYPLFLRLWLWALLKLLRAFTPDAAHADLKQTLEYILKYPRRVYTNLFPARATWWLVFMLFVLNGTDWIGFEILNLGNPALSQIPVGSRVIDGLFQALAVRSGGFVVVSISQMYIGLQVLYVVMMYISVYPVVITMRHSNVYEERSLGIYADDVESGGSSAAEEEAEGRPASRRGPPGLVGRALRGALTQFHGVGAAAADARAESRISFLSHQVRGQLSHDMWLLVLAVFAISVIETRHFLDDPVTFSTFNILFEVVSAYGTVGISTGLPGAAYSFSGGLYPGSKLVLCLVMLRGRHRGLPVALDRAVRLPGDHLVRDEEEDYRIRRSMSMRDV